MEGLAGVALHEYLFSPTQPGKYNSYRSHYLHFCGVMYIRHTVEIAARSVSRFNNTVYRYEWAYSQTYSNNPHWHPKASIGEEVVFIFPNPSKNITKFTKEDQSMRDKFMRSWIAFVKTG